MVYIFIIILIASLAMPFLLGKAYAKAKTKRELDNIRSKSIEKAEYDLLYDLQPVEVSVLCTGYLDQHAIAGQAVYFASQGIINLRRNDQSGRVESIRNRLITPSDDSRSLVGLFSELHEPFPLPSRIYDDSWLLLETEKRLIKKGWLLPAELRHSDFKTEKFDKILLVSTIVSLSVGFLSIVGLVTFEEPQQELAIALALICIISIWLILIFAIYIRSFKITYDKHSRVLRSITPAFREKFSKLYGLYIYMKVSGLDTMTPMPGDLTFSGLDKLFPYALALGLDPKTTKMLF